MCLRCVEWQAAGQVSRRLGKAGGWTALRSTPAAAVLAHRHTLVRSKPAAPSGAQQPPQHSTAAAAAALTGSDVRGQVVSKQLRQLRLAKQPAAADRGSGHRTSSKLGSKARSAAGRGGCPGNASCQQPPPLLPCCRTGVRTTLLHLQAARSVDKMRFISLHPPVIRGLCKAAAALAFPLQQRRHQHHRWRRLRLRAAQELAEYEAHAAAALLRLPSCPAGLCRCVEGPGVGLGAGLLVNK